MKQEAGLTVEAIIGLEIHVQLATRTKMWCGCAVEFGQPPNSRVCPVCLGLPGALPTTNRQAVEFAVLTGLALNGEIARASRFDRKNYYYPDLPKNYQISQYDQPLCTGGYVELKSDHKIHKIRIRRAHLEEDAGKSIHDSANGTAIDLNRAGTPLLEIVTEPDFHSADEAREFAVQLQRLVRYLGVSEANLQKGQMRFEPNINLQILAQPSAAAKGNEATRQPGTKAGDQRTTPQRQSPRLSGGPWLQPWGTRIDRPFVSPAAEATGHPRGEESSRTAKKSIVDSTEGGRAIRTPIVEVKNLNSFHALHAAISFELERQLQEWRDTGEVAEVGNKRNRGWNDVREVTTPQREKEEAHDYRYFPDPDLAALTTDPRRVAELREQLPELPIPRTERFISEYKLLPQDAAALVDCRGTADLLDQAAEAGADKLTLVKHFLSFWSKYAHQRRTTVAGLGLAAPRLAELVSLVKDGKVNATAAAQIAQVMAERADRLLGDAPRPEIGWCHGEFPRVDSPELSPARLAEELGLLQCSDEDEIAAWVDQALAANQQAVRDALASPKKLKAARGFLAGQVMKLSGGKADPTITGELIDKKLSG